MIDPEKTELEEFLKEYTRVRRNAVLSQNPHTKWFIVRHKYRAKNQYGATQIYNQIFTLDSLGTVISVSDVE